MKRLIRLSAGTSGMTYGAFRGLEALGYDVVDVAPYDGSATAELAPITEASISEVSSPLQLGDPPEIYRKTVPPIHPLIFADVTVRSDSSVLCQTRQGLVPRHTVQHRHRISWENGRSCAFDAGGRLVFEKRPEIEIAKGICGFGEASYNWYHWLIEILPMIMLAQDLGSAYQDYPLLVPEEVLANRTFRETLALFQGTREIIPLKSKDQYRVGELVFIPPPVYGPFNMHRGYWPELSDYSQNINVLKRFRAYILEQLDIMPEPDTPRRIFLARAATARQYNQDELIAIAQDMDFESIRMETLSFREQVRILHGAELVVGPSGAAWSGALFMRPEAQGLAWVLKEYTGGSFFSSLSCVSGSQLTYLFVQAEKNISGTHDAITTPYSVPADVFTDRLQALIARSPVSIG